MPYEEAIGVRGFDVSPKGAEIFLRFESEEALKNGKDEIVSLLSVENDVTVYAVTEPLRSLEEYKNFRAKSGRVFSLFASIALVLPVVEWLRLFCLALTISGVLGILSGLAPAIMASNQDPVECLRME